MRSRDDGSGRTGQNRGGTTWGWGHESGHRKKRSGRGNWSSHETWDNKRVSRGSKREKRCSRILAGFGGLIKRRIGKIRNHSLRDGLSTTAGVSQGETYWLPIERAPWRGEKERLYSSPEGRRPRSQLTEGQSISCGPIAEINLERN